MLIQEFLFAFKAQIQLGLSDQLVANGEEALVRRLMPISMNFIVFEIITAAGVESGERVSWRSSLQRYELQCSVIVADILQLAE